MSGWQHVPWIGWEKDPHGTQTPKFGPSVEVPGMGFEPQQTVERGAGVSQGDRQASDRVVQPARLYGPYGLACDPRDRWRAPWGDLFEVEGEAAYWESPLTGWQAGVVITLRRVVG